MGQHHVPAGRELSVRLPSGQDYAAQVAKEHRWLPVLAGRLPLPVPEPVALGRPAAGFPWPWSVYRWIEGEPACLGPVTNLAGFAADLASFLAALYAIDARAARQVWDSALASSWRQPPVWVHGDVTA